MVNVHIWESKNEFPRMDNELSGKENLQGPVATKTVFVFLFFLNINILYPFYFSFVFLINLFLTVLGLCCCARALSSYGEQGLLFVVEHRLLIPVAFLVVEHGL